MKSLAACVVFIMSCIDVYHDMHVWVRVRVDFHHRVLIARADGREERMARSLWVHQF